MEVSKRRLSEEKTEDAIVVSKKARVDGAIIVAEAEQREKAVGRLSSLPQPTMQLIGHESEVFGIDFSPSGDILASCSFDRTIVLWNMKDDECAAMTIMRGHKSSISDLKWMNDGECVVTASADKTAAIWDVVTAERIKQMKGHTSYVNAVSVARRDSNEPWKIATGSDDRTVRVWDRRVKGRRAAHVLTHDYQVLSQDFSDEEYTLYSGGIDNTLHKWDLRKPESPILRLVGHSNTITDVTVNAEATHVVSNGMDNVCKIWDIRPYVEGGDDSRHVVDLIGHQHQLEKNLIRCAWSPNGAAVASGGGDRMVWVWSAITGEILYKLPGHNGCVNNVAFHPREPIIASASSDKTIFLGEIELPG